MLDKEATHLENTSYRVSSNRRFVIDKTALVDVFEMSVSLDEKKLSNWFDRFIYVCDYLWYFAAEE